MSNCDNSLYIVIELFFENVLKGTTSNKFVVWDPVRDLLTMFVYTKILEIGLDISRATVNFGLVDNAFNKLILILSPSHRRKNGLSGQYPK